MELFGKFISFIKLENKEKLIYYLKLLLPLNDLKKKMWTFKKRYIFVVFWLYSKFNNLAKKIKSQQILKSHCEEETSIFKSIIDSITKKICQCLLQRVNEFFKFSRRMLFTLPSKRILKTSDKNIQYYPCCDISQWTFNKKRKTIFILPWKATIYFFDSVYKVKGSPILPPQTNPRVTSLSCQGYRFVWISWRKSSDIVPW